MSEYLSSTSTEGQVVKLLLKNYTGCGPLRKRLMWRSTGFIALNPIVVYSFLNTFIGGVNFWMNWSGTKLLALSDDL